jgi:hypothetical protein
VTESPCPVVKVMMSESPRCQRCFSRMVLARAEPAKGGLEKRIFECPKCHFTETKVIGDPLKSGDVIRLTETLRPPS